MMTKTGTNQFNAPEIFTDSCYTEKIDIWGTGATLYMVLSGGLPAFENKSEPKLIQQIISQQPDYTLPSLQQISEDALDLVR